MQNFGRQVQGADVALFYYAGHGVQVSGANYLVPVNANPTREADVDFQMVDINLVLRQMQGSGTRLNMVILDACRNNPFGARELAGGGRRPRPDAGAGRHADFLCDAARQRCAGWRDGNSPYTKALASTVRQAGLDIFQTFNQVGLAVKRATAGRSSPGCRRRRSTVPSISWRHRRRLLRPPLSRRTANRKRAWPIRCVRILTGCRSRMPMLLRELSDRLYEHNFDPEAPDSKNGMKLAIAKFQEKSSMTPTGEATEGVLTRLRKMDDLKPWGSIVFNPDTRKWGISWKQSSRRAAVDDARAKCGGAKCEVELSFYGTRCGAFAFSGNSWSLIQRDTVEAARGAALDACSKTGKSCRIIDAVCANESNR